MINVTRKDGKIVFDVEGADKLWSFRSRLEVPDKDVCGARRDPFVVEGSHGLRLPGTYVPGLLTAGTFYHDDRRIFWDVHHPDNAIVVELVHEHYDELVIEVENPDAVIAMLNGR